MVNTLRIISLIAAVLAVVFFVFPVLRGVDSDKQVKEFLKAPEIREKFESAADSRVKRNKDLTAPLVQQAQAFASYLNPKPTAKPAGIASRGSRTASILPVTPKFKLRCTSYCESDPNLSLALIDEPGRGRHWVRQSDKVGHLQIAQIKDGRVVVQGGAEDAFEIGIEESTVKETSPIPKRTTPTGRLSLPTSSRASFSAAKASATKPKKVEPDESERDARARALVEKIKALKENAELEEANSPQTANKDKAERLEKLISQYQSTLISPEEAKKLGNLGKTLKGEEESEPNRIPDQTGKVR